MKQDKRKNRGNGLGPHQQVSPMGHATRTPSKRERQAKADRREKRRGWEG